MQWKNNQMTRPQDKSSKRKVYVVSTQKNCLIETVLLSPTTTARCNNNFMLKSRLSGPMDNLYRWTAMVEILSAMKQKSLKCFSV